VGGGGGGAGAPIWPFKATRTSCLGKLPNAIMYYNLVTKTCQAEAAGFSLTVMRQKANTLRICMADMICQQDKKAEQQSFCRWRISSHPPWLRCRTYNT